MYTEAEKIIAHLRREIIKHRAIMEMADLPPSLAERLTQIRALIQNDIDDAEKVIGYSDCVWALVDVDISKLSLKSKRVNITIPERLLNTVDHYAKNHCESRSGLLAQAITEYMATHK